MTDQDQDFESNEQGTDVKIDQVQMNGPWSEKVSDLPFHGCPCCTRPVMMESTGRLSMGRMGRECPECEAEFMHVGVPPSSKWKLVSCPTGEISDRVGDTFNETGWAALTEQRRLGEGARRAVDYVKEKGGVPDGS